MTAWLTLATGEDRWEENGSSYRLKVEGALWVLAWPDDRASIHEHQVILKPEVADWCFETIGPYRIVERAPSGRFGPEHDDSWEIEFKSEGDKLAFQLRWGEK
jgi:hypothetical protein